MQRFINNSIAQRFNGCATLSFKLFFSATVVLAYPGRISNNLYSPSMCQAKVSNLAKTRPSGDGASCLSPKREGTSSTSTPGRQSLQAFLPMGELGRRRALLNTIVSVAFGGVMHGTHCLFPLALVSGAFAVGHALKGTRLAQPATWILAILLVWLKERWYRAFTFGGLFGPLFSWLDVYAGMHPWRLTFNLAILRIISFNIDMHWAEQQVCPVPVGRIVS